ncbi:MAG: acetyl-CoA carboxylase carboxyltransferase subunit beta [Eubacteriales bacterium]|jgi:acetyl-CoA carboxylase carboxyl transferase subunit beta|nr:acetyl-CoA carboxylase carboxyltransferase subunit beta [Eubacteriales bacterium]
MFKKARYATIPVSQIKSENALETKKSEEKKRLSAKERISLMADEETFVPMFEELRTENPLDFEGYEEKIQGLIESTGSTEGITVGECEIGGQKVCMGVMDSTFLMGSMGSVVGERLTRLFEHATQKRLPVVVFCASGGARMHEGIFSLMQMAKVSAAVMKHSQAGLLYISVLTDPTTGGVTASFAMLGDIIIAEPKALIGFAGKRVIESTISQTLPEGFQSAEFLLKHGFIDLICERSKLKDIIANIIDMHSFGGEGV